MKEIMNSISQILTTTQQNFQLELDEDPTRFRLWEDFIFDVYQGDEGQLKKLHERVQKDNLYDGFSLLLSLDSSGSICVNSNIPNVSRSFVCLLLFQVALKAPSHPFLSHQRLLCQSRSGPLATERSQFHELSEHDFNDQIGKLYNYT